ncbi:MAG: aspartyl/asparaginyl beta-hydroxylase domain-containing protein [Pseudomonadota bacterium]
MDFDADQKCLGKVDAEALRTCILDQPESAWTEQAIRQQSYEVHRDTQSIVMLFCDESWPNGEIYKESGWDRLTEQAEPLIEHIINTYYEPGGLVLRAMAARLVAGGRILPHRDSLHSFHIGHRIHIPITSGDGVRYTVSGRPYQFEPGQAYEINNQRKHSVMNLGTEPRISFIFDYVPADKIPENLRER